MKFKFVIYLNHNCRKKGSNSDDIFQLILNQEKTSNMISGLQNNKNANTINRVTKW